MEVFEQYRAQILNGFGYFYACKFCKIPAKGS